MEKGFAVSNEKPSVHFYQVTASDSVVPQILNALYHLNLQSILVEGGAQLLQSFIDEDIWDEARVISNEEMVLGSGLPAPVLKNFGLEMSEKIFSDSIRTYKNLNGPLQHDR